MNSPLIFYTHTHIYIYIYIYMGQNFQAGEKAKIVSLFPDFLWDITNILVEIFGFGKSP